MKLIILILIIWPITTYMLFLTPTHKFPALTDRFGNLMWQSAKRSNLGTLVTHNYCYYPKNPNNLNTPNLFLRQDSGDCSNFYGQVLLEERDWQSEKDKIWTSQEEYQAETEGSLSQNNKNQDNKN